MDREQTLILPCELQSIAVAEIKERSLFMQRGEGKREVGVKATYIRTHMFFYLESYTISSICRGFNNFGDKRLFEVEQTAVIEKGP